jgi:predicted exporter
VRLGLFALFSAVLSAYVWLCLDMRTAITDFLPRDEKAERLELSRELAQSTQSRAVVLAISGGEGHVQAAKRIARALASSGEFAWVRAGLEPTEQELFYKLYFPARLGLLALPPGQGRVPDAFLHERIAQMKARLASPLGMLERRLAPEDPLGAFQDLLASFGRERGSLELRDGQLVTSDGTHSLMFAETRAPAFDTTAQGKVQAAIVSAFGAEKAKDGALTLHWAGVNRFALAGEKSVKADIGRISTLSLVGIFILYMLIFRSLREPLVVLLPISFGCLLAVAVCQGLFGFVHGLSLAFGSSIIGVAEDFSTHFFAHRRATPREESNEALMQRLWPGMWLGAATTIIGILALTFSGFPGLVQMAVFGSAGVLGALLCTRYVVPELSRKGPLPPTRRLGPWGISVVRGLARRPARSLWLIVPALLCALGATQLKMSSGMRALRTPTPELDAENERIQELLGRQAAGRAVVAVGKTDEEALERAEEAAAKLDAALQQGLLEAYRSVTRLVPSEKHQREVRARLHEPTLVPRLRSELAAAGFTAEAFAPFEAELARPDPVLLTPAQILASPLGDVVRPFRVELKKGIAYLIPVTTTRSAELGASFAAGGTGIFYLDQEALFDDAYSLFRVRAIWLLVVGLVLVVLTLLARYRDVRVAALGMLPAVLGAGATLGVEGLWGVEVTLMHVIAILLVVSMGVDYGIYVLESRESLEEGVTTLGSILLAALTTVLSFGLLGVSDNPALAGIGITVSIGLLFTVLLSPVVLALARDVEVS